MFGFSGAIKFYYCPTPISMRKSFDGLAGAVEEYIQQEPESGHAFVFFGRSRKMVKILQWQGDGIWSRFRIFRSQSQNGEDFAMAGRRLYDLDEALGKRCLSPSQISGRAD